MAPDLPRRHGVVGLAAVLAAGLAAGVLGIVPFLIGAYTVLQGVLVPLGVGQRDTSRNDAGAILITVELLAVVLVLVTWAWVTRATATRYAVPRPAAWPLALLGLCAPTAVFVLLNQR